MAASNNMKLLIAGGKHVQTVMSRSPLMRPGTRSPHVDGDAADTFSNRCTAFSRWTAQPGVWRRPEAGAPSTRPGARRKGRRDPGARRSRSGCSRSGCDTPKGHRKRNGYFDLLEKIACPFHHAGVVSVAGGGRATLIMACQNQFAADALRSFCGSTPVLAPPDRAHWQVENGLQ